MEISFEEVKQIFHDSIDGSANLNELLQNVANAIYQNGYADRDAEIVRCKDCKWRANNGATSSKWLPCMDNRYDDEWFCADGERKE